MAESFFRSAVLVAVLIAAGLPCAAFEETNVVAASDWSAPVDHQFHALRGRLLILEGAPADNRLTMFVELQNAQPGAGTSLKLFFDVMDLKCELTDARGKPGPEPLNRPWGGRGPFPPGWVILPYASTLRLFVNPGTREPLTLCPGGEPWRSWVIPAADTNTYYLSATLTVATPTNASLVATPHAEGNIHEYTAWQGTLVFPKFKLPGAPPGPAK